MRHSVWNKKVPGLFGLLLVGIGILIAYFLSQNTAIFTGQAAPGNTPDTVRISNITDKTFTVSYTTTDKVLGSVKYGTDPNTTSVAMDDRDQKSGTPQPYYTHHITLKDLSPNTKYYFTILSGDESFLENDIPYTVVTESPISGASPNQIPLTGTLSLPDGTISSDALIYVEGPDTQLVSGITGSDGAYAIPFSTFRNKQLSSFAALTEDTKLQLNITAHEGASNVFVLASQINPVPQVVITKDYDFSISEEPLIPPSDEAGGLPAVAEPINSRIQVSIVTPKADEGFKDPRPLFKGTAFPSKDVDININTPEIIETTVVTTTAGNWTYRPPTPLPPGKYTITIESRDTSEVLRTVKQDFSIFTEGSNFTEPSVSPVKATPTPTVRPTRTPGTPTPTTPSTPTPTILSPIPTQPSPTVAEATPTVIMTSPAPSIPPTGSVSYIITGIAAIATFGVGILLLALL